MKVVRPSWINHNGALIHSCDVHPVQGKLITAGGSARLDTGGLVLIWSVDGLFDVKNGDLKCPRSAALANENLPENGLLCRIELNVPANIVRWSADGQRFVVGYGEAFGASTDNTAAIYTYCGRVASSGGLTINQTSEANLMESWKCTNTLRGHKADVLHAEWSPNGAWLATCSTDTSVIVWNANANFEVVAKLRSHDDQVRGLAWDPLMAHLVTQSTDNSLRIWETKTWSCAKKIREPFEKSSTVPFTRCHWSADGRTIVAVNATNNQAPTAQLIMRSKQSPLTDRNAVSDAADPIEWSHQQDLAGHRKSVICARWSPCLYWPRANDLVTQNRQRQPCGVLALCDRGATISIWQYPTCRRPRVVIRQLASEAIYDVVWSKNGQELYACSMDGSVVAIRFKPDDFGIRLTTPQLVEHMQREFGSQCLPPYLSSLALNGHSANGDIVEEFCDDPAVIVARRLQREKELAATAVNPPMATSTTTAIAAVTTATTTTTAQQLTTSSNTSITTTSTTTAPVSTTSTTSTTVAPKQTETKDKSGKRRITPMFLGSTSITPSAPVAVPIQTQSTTSSTPSSSIMPNAPSSTTATAAKKAPTPSPLANVETLKRALQTTSLEQIRQSSSQPTRPGSAAGKKHRKHGRVRVIDDDDESEEEETETTSSSARQTASVSAGVTREPIFPAPEPQKQLNKNWNSQTIRVLNATGSRCTRLQLLEKPTPKMGATPDNSMDTDGENQTVLLETVLDSRVILMAVSSSYICCALTDHTIHVLDHSLRPIGCAVLLPEPCALLCCTDTLMMAITVQANCYLINLRTQSALMSNEPLTPLTRTADSVKIRHETLLDDSQIPVIWLTNGRVYAFDYRLRMWVLLADEQSTIGRMSSHALQVQHGDESVTLSMNASLNVSQSPTKQSSDADKSRSSVMCNLSQIERALQVSALLKKPIDYKDALIKYVAALVSSGELVRVKNLCNDLLMSDSSNEHNFLSSTPLTLSERREFLNTHVVELLASNATFADYQRQLVDLLAENTTESATLDSTLNTTLADCFMDASME